MKLKIHFLVSTKRCGIRFTFFEIYFDRVFDKKTFFKIQLQPIHRMMLMSLYEVITKWFFKFHGGSW
ncbi:MAG TPA: hypothetical protein DCL41_07635 [Bdellovibrionales bacterium]|nr:hypothetical protein [Pseudobdellovibrionaceae bacterium]HAG91727.1 hypothetical protein [Bdellovibrionales bacterium]